jgi:hypothetical protein
MDKIKIIELPKILDIRGNLSFIEENKHIPFEIKRAYWLYDVPGGEKRGGHAYRNNIEFIIALSGSFDIEVSDGNKTMKYTLNRSYYGLLVPNLLWREMSNFSTNSLAMIVASTEFNISDYIYDFEVFKSIKANEQK